MEVIRYQMLPEKLKCESLAHKRLGFFPNSLVPNILTCLLDQQHVKM